MYICLVILLQDEAEKPAPEKFYCSVLPAVQAGHTGYLTFATLLPEWARPRLP